MVYMYFYFLKFTTLSECIKSLQYLRRNSRFRNISVKRFYFCIICINWCTRTLSCQKMHFERPNTVLSEFENDISVLVYLQVCPESVTSEAMTAVQSSILILYTPFTSDGGHCTTASISSFHVFSYHLCLYSSFYCLPTPAKKSLLVSECLYDSCIPFYLSVSNGSSIYLLEQVFSFN